MVINNNHNEILRWVNFVVEEKSVLIATDVAARGLDIQDIQFVINIDVRNNYIFFHSN